MTIDPSTVPTLEELPYGAKTTCWKDANNNPICVVPWSYRDTLLVAPINLSVLSVTLSFEYWTLPASDTSYWRADLQVGSGATWTTVATRSTQNTGSTANGGITARTPWTFDAAVSTTTPISLTMGQLLAIAWTPVGSPAAMLLPVTYTMRPAAA